MGTSIFKSLKCFRGGFLAFPKGFTALSGIKIHCAERKTRKSHTWSLTMIPTRASLCNGKASFMETAERLPRKEPHKAVGPLFVDVECTSRPELASHQRGRAGVAPVPRTEGALSLGHSPCCFQACQIPFFNGFQAFKTRAFTQQLQQKQEEVRQAVSSLF